jgi:hypothetical protein
MVVHKKQMGQDKAQPHLFFRELCPQIRTKKNLESVALQHFQDFSWGSYNTNSRKCCHTFMN